MKFYVTMVTDANRKACLLGPFDTKEDAEAQAKAGRDAAIALDPYNHFNSFGVTGVELPDGETYPTGRLNSALLEKTDGAAI